MATRDSIVQVPFIGGVDEGADPDQLQAPAMKSLVNVTTRKPGRIEKRAGFEFLAQTGSTTVPATTFGGASAVLPSDVEAVGAYNGADGTRTIVAAGNKLFEYVGLDAAHGFREVNRLPSCYGTLHPVGSSGGSITEIESVVNESGTLRFTVWVFGTRTGTEATNDSVVSKLADQGGVWLTVEKTDDNGVVLAPTRLATSSSAYSTAASDLRITRVFEPHVVDAIVIAWRQKFDTGSDGVEAAIVDASTGVVHSTFYLGGFAAFSKIRYHRPFDITAVPNSSDFLFAKCKDDAIGASSDVDIERINISAFIPATTQVIWNVLSTVAAVGISGGVDWQVHQPRGVVLETTPTEPDKIAISIRTVYTKASLPYKYDGKIVAAVVVTTGGTLSMSPHWAWLHRVGFQTAESLTVFAAGTTGVVGYAGDIDKAGFTGTGIINTNILSPLVKKIYPTAVYFDGSEQVFQMYVDQAGTSPVWPLQHAQLNAPDAAQDLENLSKFYQRVPHSYSGNTTANYYEAGGSGVTTLATVIQLVPSLPAPAPDRARIVTTWVTRVDILSGPLNIPAITSASVVAEIYDTAVHVCCIAVVWFDAAGNATEIRVKDGRPGFAAVYAGPHEQFAFKMVVPSYGQTLILGGPAGTIWVAADLIGAFDQDGTTLAGICMIASGVKVEQINYYTSGVPEQCVHRWDVSFAAGRVILAVSSTSPLLFGGPSGASPLSSVSPHAENNYFEVYDWFPALSYSLNTFAGGTEGPRLWCALGGPWRMVSSLSKMPDGRPCCVLMPSGDPLQKSAFLVSFSMPDPLVSLLQPNLPAVEQPDPTVEGYIYAGNSGVFVESVNMARVMAVPANCPRLTPIVGGNLAVGMLRGVAGQSSTQVYSCEYVAGATGWRKITPWSNYSICNGGVASLYDGQSVYECASMVWPQGDLCSVSYDRAPELISAGNDAAPWGATESSSSMFYIDKYPGSPYPEPQLHSITRPWFRYETGAFGEWGDGGVGSMVTSWGGLATDDYQSVYADPRLLVVGGSKSPGQSSTTASGAVQHYYGRYQSGSATSIPGGPSRNRVFWTPRATDVFSTVASTAGAKYTPVVAGGDFLLTWCYESNDATGRRRASAPCRPVSFTIVAWVDIEKGKAGGVVSEYRYGFFAPRLELTNRAQISEADAYRTALQPYVTAEPFASILYMVPSAGLLAGYGPALAVGRNTSRGVVPYATTAMPYGTAYNRTGIVTNNFRCFDGPQGDYNGILSQPYLYTTGGVLDNVCPPSALCMCIHQNRLVLGGADDTTVVWFSKELSPTDAPGFNDALTIQIEEGGAVTGLASFNGLLFVFKRRTAFVVAGDMPDDTGGGIGRGNGSISSLATPVRMAHDIGCINHRSVVETPIGIFFQSERTLELLDQNMSITPVGFALEETMAAFPEVTNAIHHPKDNEVWFTVHTVGAAGAAGEQFRVLVFNYLTKQWSTSKFGAIGTGRVQLGLVDNRPCLAATGAASGVVYRQTPSKFFDVAPTGRQYVAMSGTTAPVALNQIQGYERVKRLRVFGNPVPSLSTGAAQTREPHGFSMMLQSDFKNTGVFSGSQTATWTQSESLAVWTDQSREVYEVHLANQKCQQVVLSFAETAPSDITTLTHGYGTSLSNMALVVGLKSGLDKKITSDAKH